MSSSTPTQLRIYNKVHLENSNKKATLLSSTHVPRFFFFAKIGNIVVPSSPEKLHSITYSSIKKNLKHAKSMIEKQFEYDKWDSVFIIANY